MTHARNRGNPFYILLIPAGILFAVTAFAHGFMAFVAVNSLRADAARNAEHPLYQWLRLHGQTAIFGELAILAALTVAAIGLDSWRSKSEPTAPPP